MTPAKEGEMQEQRASARPAVITAVAVVMFIGGAFSLLGGLLAILGGSVLIGFGGGMAVLFGIVWIGLGAAQIWVGMGVLRLQETARVFGLVLAGVSMALTIVNVASGAGAAFLGIAIDAFIIWALVTNKELFS
jgi:hypothetical protein